MPDLGTATVTGSPLRPDVNVRSGPGTVFDVLFKASKGESGLPILETRRDYDRFVLDGRPISWHRLQFPARDGWVREDLLSVGDHASQGTVGTITIVAPPVYVAPASNPPRIATAGEVNVRSAPSLGATKLGILNNGSEAVVIGVHNDKDGAVDEATGLVYRWYGLAIGGYVREDVVRRRGNWTLFGLSEQVEPPPYAVNSLALWPAPVSGYKITNTHLNANGHRGVDYACPRGTPVYAAPVPGLVVKTFTCTKCDANGNRGDFGPSKGSGYGTYAIVRYAWQTGYVFCMYAHLSRLDVREGQELTGLLGGQAIGLVGATGNTYSINGGDPSHLHMECRLSDAADAKWGAIEAGGINPGRLFRI